MPSIIRWVNSEPQNLEVERLDKYFFLTRESLKKSDVVVSTMSESVKDILQRIGTATSGLMKKISEDIEQLSASEQDDIVKVLAPQIEKGELQYYVIRDVFKSLTAYRGRITDALSKTRRTLKPGDIPAIKTMRTLEKDAMDALIAGWKEKNFIDQKMYDDLKKGK